MNSLKMQSHPMNLKKKPVSSNQTTNTLYAKQTNTDKSKNKKNKINDKYGDTYIDHHPGSLEERRGRRAEATEPLRPAPHPDNRGADGAHSASKVKRRGGRRATILRARARARRRRVPAEMRARDTGAKVAPNSALV